MTSISERKIIECLQSLGYVELTDLQKKVFNIITSTKNSVVIIAPTGSGKTEAALFPIMYLIYSRKLKPLTAIYITPLRALNRDIEERLLKISKCFDVKIALRHGDTPQNLRKSIERDPPHILVTTPESLNYIIINTSLRKYLENLEFIIIDEFRELVENKRGYQLFTIIYLLEKRVLKKKIRKVALTATLKNEKLAQRILDNSVRTKVVVDNSVREIEIELAIPSGDLVEKSSIGKVIQDRELGARVAYIINKLINHSGVLVFTNTRSLAERLGFVLSKVIEASGLIDINIGVHHGSLDRSHRVSVEKGFKTGFLRGLIATSSMELGIDIGKVDYVIQYMSPRQATRLLQRIGRSGHRLGGVSRGSILTNNNLFQVLESSVLIRRAISYEIEEEKKYSSPLDVLAYSIATYALIDSNGIDIYELYNDLVNYELYRELDATTYFNLLDYLQYVRIIKINNSKIYPTRKTRLYVYRVNMIPDTRNIDVVETSSGKKIGVLNEEYVVLNIKEGDTLVLGGILWRVIGYSSDENKLYVERIDVSREVLIPHWEGENIPVEYKVAREVGSIVRRAREGYFIGGYQLPEAVIKDLRENGSLFGDDKTIVIDYCSDYNTVFINVFSGSRVNRLIRDLLKTIILNRYPFLNINTYSTPYAVLIEFERKVPTADLGDVLDLVERVLTSLNKYLEVDFLKTVASKHGPLLWRIYQVAQRFGAVDPESTKVSRTILSNFTDTVIGLEAFKEVLYRDYDIDSAMKLGELLSKGCMRIVKRSSDSLSKYHYELLRYIEIPRIEVVKPFDRESYRERVLNRKVTIICIRCGYYKHGRIRDFLKTSLNCPICKYKSLSITKTKGLVEREIVLKNNTNQKLSSSEKRILENLRNRAILLIEFGDLALITLGSRGVGYSDAKKIISRVRSGEDLYEILYEYEKRLIRVKKYIEKKSRN